MLGKLWLHQTISYSFIHGCSSSKTLCVVVRTFVSSFGINVLELREKMNHIAPNNATSWSCYEQMSCSSSIEYIEKSSSRVLKLIKKLLLYALLLHSQKQATIFTARILSRSVYIFYMHIPKKYVSHTHIAVSVCECHCPKKYHLLASLLSLDVPFQFSYESK